MASLSDILVTTSDQYHPPRITKDKPEIPAIIALIVMVSIMGSASIVFHRMGWQERTSRRLIFLLSSIMAVSSALSYLAMVSMYGTGYNCEILNPTSIPSYEATELYCRMTFGTQSLDWFITSTIVIIQLSLLAGLNGATTFAGLVSNVFLFACGRVASDRYRLLSNTRIAWTVFATIFFCFVVWQVGVNSLRAAKSRGAAFQKPFSRLLEYALLTFTVQYIIFMVAHVWGVVSTNTEMIAFIIADALFKPVFGFWLLNSYARIPDFQFELEGYWSGDSTRNGPSLLTHADE
ncbi:hypothetical protein V2A60_007836 [Cordyceps javanica]|uniref:Bacteriorhodopsin-like protein domain-containing protein n=1 Tax=Cordyceps javanica TaxID=43265 RepID=A0A545V9N2_9HYPO|nr:bacteriorhodopsin-like protein domain-containing protein [Cordyceps javanica]TQW09633.1 bacteriorhodopsin-like protein domain-containing protein [Cordyceps javanica]